MNDWEIRTPADIRAMRMALGLSLNEMAQLVGVEYDTTTAYEAPRCKVVFDDWRVALYRLRTSVETWIESMCLPNRMAETEVLVVFNNDYEFQRHTHGLERQLMFASVHHVASQRLAERLPSRPALVMFQPKAFAPIDLNLPESDNLRLWAMDRLREIRIQ